MSINITTSQWRPVEVGRVVLLHDGKCAGKLAVIVEIIDHKRVLIDSPASVGVLRQAYPLKHVQLTSIVIPKLPRGCRTRIVTKLWEKEGVASKWESCTWAKKIKAREARHNLSDFERFKVNVLRKQRRTHVRIAFSKAKKAVSK